MMDSRSLGFIYLTVECMETILEDKALLRYWEMNYNVLSQCRDEERRMLCLLVESVEFEPTDLDTPAPSMGHMHAHIHLPVYTLVRDSQDRILASRVREPEIVGEPVWETHGWDLAQGLPRPEARPPRTRGRRVRLPPRPPEE